MLSFHYQPLEQDVIFGAGAVEHSREVVERAGWRRLMLCTTASARSRGQLEALEKAVGEWLVVRYEKVQPHVQEDQVAEALDLAESNEVEAVIGLGGGSPIGMAKAVSAALHDKRAESAAGPALIPVIAVPTTYAGSEMTPVYGVTRRVDGAPRKITASDPRIAPRLVLYDPGLTLELPPELTATTGINALAHCLEALYSITRHPLSTAAAVEGARRIVRALPRCFARGDDLEARTDMLSGAYLAGTALASVSMGLHHGLCHVLGGTAGVPHGAANCIILPHALRFNLDATAPQLALAAEAMGVARPGQEVGQAAAAAVQHVHDLISHLNGPWRLRAAGIDQADLPALAVVAFENRTVRSNPKPITGAEQIEAVLEAAW